MYRFLQIVVLILCLTMMAACSDGYAGSDTTEPSALPQSGRWKAEDCKKVSDASGIYLYSAGQVAEQSDAARKAGRKHEADELIEGVMALSSIAADYAVNFEAYCKP